MKLALITAMSALLLAIGPFSLRADDDSVLFSDDFSTLDPAWGDANDQERVENNKLVLHPSADRSYVALYQGNLFDDVDIRVKIAQAHGTADIPAGIAFWGTDPGAFYMAQISPDGSFSVTRMMNHRWLNAVGWQRSEVIKQGSGQTNELRLVTQGNLATFYVNGQQVTSFHGYPPSGGSKLGLSAESGAQLCTWQFSDLKVLKAPALDAPPSSGADSGTLFADDFATLDPGWAVDKNVHVDGHKLIVVPKVGFNYLALYQGTLFGDSEVSVTVAHTKGSANAPVGIMFWGTSNQDFYSAGIMGVGMFYVERMTHNKMLMPVAGTPTDAINKDPTQANKLRVSMKGNSATFYVNDKAVITLKGFPPNGGGLVGLCGSALKDEPGTWEFSNFSVRKLP